MGRGIEWLESEYSLTSKYGFSYSRVDASDSFSHVTYKDVSLNKTDPVSTISYVTDDTRASVVSWLEGEGGHEPYLINSGNFWLFADIPMIQAGEDSAYLVLADVLHDALKQPHAVDHQAMVRIEDVHPNIDTVYFNQVVNYLYNQEVPFAIALIPVYINPDTGEEIHLSDRPDFVKAIREAERRGGIIVLHGYTHQLYGLTGVDHEFWDNRVGAFPTAESVEWTREKVESGLREARAEGINPIIWETPHYNASDLVHKVIAQYFPVAWERRDAPFFPYVVTYPDTGQILLPETLGYIRAEDRPASDLLAVAASQRVVRDSYASFFFHLHIKESQMHEMINGLKDEGYVFTSPAEVAGLPYTPPEPPSWLSKFSNRVSESLSIFIPQGLKQLSSATVMTLLAIFIIFYYWGIFLLSRKQPAYRGKFNPDLSFVIVVPALNEELVIGKTLDHLTSLKNDNLLVLVVNDDSDDRTREIVLQYPKDKVKLIDHPRALAQQGKGRVLNYAFRYLMSSDIVREKGANNVIFGVLDADGRVEQNVATAVNPYFSNPRSGAVQVGVRISNANTNILTKWQNFEFLAFARLAQKAREHIGSVGLGGNGQFVRLSALASLGSEPWTDCLTEDLDLGIRLMLKGWQNHYCARTFVAQQGVPTMRPLIRQRTRWFQGHLTCWRHIPALIQRHKQASARIDTIYYLLAPLMVFIFLPSSLLFIVWSIYFITTGASSLTFSPQDYIPAMLVWYLFSFGAVPTVVWTFWREEKDMSGWKAFLWAHIFSFFYVFWFFAGIKAVIRLARGEGSWAKTSRVEEVHQS
jgi:cellulose synthase/poly-beta-1,6-N-acetylglucosamine synthase-like glycosyltransferase